MQQGAVLRVIQMSKGMNEEDNKTGLERSQGG